MKRYRYSAIAVVLPLLLNPNISNTQPTDTQTTPNNKWRINKPTAPTKRDPGFAFGRSTIPPGKETGGRYDPNTYNFVDLLGGVFTHPRCVNCHSFEAPGGKLEQTHIPDKRLPAFDHYRLPAVTDISQFFNYMNVLVIEKDVNVCIGCHDPKYTGVTEGSIRAWLPAGFVFTVGYGLPPDPWKGKTALQICQSRRMQDLIKQGDSAVKSHLLHDSRIRWAVSNGWTPIGKRPTPMPWNNFVQRVNDWVNKGRMRCTKIYKRLSIPNTSLTPRKITVPSPLKRRSDQLNRLKRPNVGLPR